jgi:hypothetical protein
MLVLKIKVTKTVSPSAPDAGGNYQRKGNWFLYTRTIKKTEKMYGHYEKNVSNTLEGEIYIRWHSVIVYSWENCIANITCLTSVTIITCKYYQQ